MNEFDLVRVCEQSNSFWCIKKTTKYIICNIALFLRCRVTHNTYILKPVLIGTHVLCWKHSDVYIGHLKEINVIINCTEQFIFLINDDIREDGIHFEVLSLAVVLLLFSWSLLHFNHDNIKIVQRDFLHFIHDLISEMHSSTL